MPIESVKIPQNVYVEDRIVGPVTLRQLAIVGIGAGFSYALYSTASKMGPVGIPMAVLLWAPAVIAAAFAFLKINDLSLFNIILLMIEHANKPSERYWSSHSGISINFVTRAAKQEIIQANAKISANADKLAELTRQLEKREQELSKLAHQHLAAVPSNTPETPSKASTLKQLDGIGVVPSPDTPAATGDNKPVNPSRVVAPGLDPARSIDGLNGNLQSFQHIFPQA